MGRLRYGVATTLDGFIASPDGSAAWIVEDVSIDFDALFAEHAAFLMGRKTYEVMLSFGGPDNRLAGRPKETVVVVSDEMKQTDYPHITVVPGASCRTMALPTCVRLVRAGAEGLSSGCQGPPWPSSCQREVATSTVSSRSSANALVLVSSAQSDRR